MPIADELTAKWKAWKAAGALTSEMESAALMIVAQVLHVRCGAVLNVLWNADNDDAPAIRRMQLNAACAPPLKPSASSSGRITQRHEQDHTIKPHGRPRE